MKKKPLFLIYAIYCINHKSQKPWRQSLTNCIDAWIFPFNSFDFVGNMLLIVFVVSSIGMAHQCLYLCSTPLTVRMCTFCLISLPFYINHEIESQQSILLQALITVSLYNSSKEASTGNQGIAIHYLKAFERSVAVYFDFRPPSLPWSSCICLHCNQVIIKCLWNAPSGHSGSKCFRC